MVTLQGFAGPPCLLSCSIPAPPGSISHHICCGPSAQPFSTNASVQRDSTAVGLEVQYTRHIHSPPAPRQPWRESHWKLGVPGKSSDFAARGSHSPGPTQPQRLPSPRSLLSLMRLLVGKGQIRKGSTTGGGSIIIWEQKDTAYLPSRSRLLYALGEMFIVASVISEL